MPGPGLLTVSIHNGDPVKAETFLGSSLASLTSISNTFIPGFPARYRSELAGPGTAYVRLGVSGTPANELSTLSLQFSERLTNDMFATPRNLGSGDADLEFALDACAQEAGEPSGPFSPTTPTAWFRWTAPASGTLKVQQSGLNTASGIGLFQGTSLQSLSRLTNGGPDITYSVFGGQSYLLRVHAGIDPSGACKFVLRFEAGPPNDMFAQRSVIHFMPTNLVGTLKNATLEPGESTDGTKSAWFEWTATADGFLFVDRATNAFLSVFSGNTMGALQPLARLFDGASKNTQPYQFRVRAGLTYQLAVTGENFFYKGDPYFIGLGFTNFTDNDDFSGRVVLSGTYNAITNRFNGATLEPSEPVHADPVRNLKSRWWSWTAPGTGPTQVSFDNPSYPPAVVLYTGNTLGSLVLVTNHLNWENNRLATARFNATQDTTYQIAGLSSTGGDLVLSLKQTLWSITKPSNNTTSSGPAAIQFEISSLTPDVDSLPTTLTVGFYPLGGQFTPLAFASSAAATNLTIPSLAPGNYQLVGRYTNASNVQFETDPVNLRLVSSNDLRSFAAPAPPWGGVLTGSVGGGAFEPDTMMPRTSRWVGGVVSMESTCFRNCPNLWRLRRPSLANQRFLVDSGYTRDGFQRFCLDGRRIRLRP